MKCEGEGECQGKKRLENLFLEKIKIGLYTLHFVLFHFNKLKKQLNLSENLFKMAFYLIIKKIL